MFKSLDISIAAVLAKENIDLLEDVNTDIFQPKLIALRTIHVLKLLWVYVYMCEGWVASKSQVLELITLYVHCLEIWASSDRQSFEVLDLKRIGSIDVEFSYFLKIGDSSKFQMTDILIFFDESIELPFRAGNILKDEVLQPLIAEFQFPFL